MKKGATGIVKQIICVVSSLAKAKSLALKNKTSAIKTRLLIFSLLNNKRVLFSSITHKLQALLGQQDKTNPDHEEEPINDQTQALVHLCTVTANANAMSSKESTVVERDEDELDEDFDDDEKYPNLRHSLFYSEEMEFEEAGGSVIDIVKNSKECGGEEFKLENEIDEVADLFIRRFHRQIRMQKQQSFKRYQEMLQRSV